MEDIGAGGWGPAAGGRSAPSVRSLLFFLLPLGVLAQPSLPTFTSTIDRTQQPYAIYVPRALKPSQRYPLLVSLHTEDTNARLNLRQILGPPDRMGRAERADDRFFVACPEARGAMGYQGIAEQDVYDMIAELERRYPIDPDRVYLTGASMGGGGALRLAETHPDRWAAVAPLCAAVPPGAEDLALNLSNLPVRFYHGEQDPIVPARESRAWQRRLLDLGVPVSYIEYPTLRHDAWDMAYKPGALLDWLLQFRRNRSPEHIHFVARSYRYDAAYWVRIDGLSPGTPASIEAARSGSHIDVRTANLDGLTLSPDGPVTSVTIDGVNMRVRPAVSHSFERSPRGWRVGRYQPSGKRPGAEGPIAEAFAGRPIFVYGSLGARTAEELEDRRRIARAAANWSTTRTRVDFAPPVKADSEVTAADLADSDLVLFGTAATNSLIARLNAGLPLALDAGAADYGLLFIAPVGKHYALVSSGLPWWTGAEESNRPIYHFGAEPLALLDTFGDFILFKGSLAHVVAEGRFDRNWKVPADAAARLAATGTISR